MEIHQLEYVIALEKYMQFSLAAEEINVSQPTLSHQIKKLEAELGVDLFVRTTRSVQLTPAGQEFVLYAKRILADLDRARNAMLDHSNLHKGSIKIGAIPVITYLGITAQIAAFQKNYPGIRLDILEGNSDQLLKKLENSELDLAFITYPYVSEAPLDFYPLIHDKLVLLLSRSHPLSKRKSVELSELAGEKFLMIKSTTGFRNYLLTACHNAGFEPNIIFESGTVETIRGLVEEGLGIAFFSYKIAKSVVNSKISIVKFDTPMEPRITGLAITKNCNLVTIKAFRDQILKAFPIS